MTYWQARFILAKNEWIRVSKLEETEERNRKLDRLIDELSVLALAIMWEGEKND